MGFLSVFTSVLALVSCVSASPASSSVSSRIIGGKPAEPDEFPEYVAISVASRRLAKRMNVPIGWLLCGGTLLNENAVLTAAHCLTLPGLQPGDLKLHKGRIATASNRVINSTYVSVSENAVVHGEYLETNTLSDIGVVKLKTSMPGPFVKLWNKPRTPMNKRVEVVGFGVNNYFIDGVQATSPNVLYKVDTILTSRFDGECRDVYRANAYRPSTELCLLGDEFDLNESALEINDNENPGFKNDCFGDSGGPSFFRGRQIGIVSRGFGDDCAKKFHDRLSIHTKVYNYRHWINRALKFLDDFP